MTKNKSQVLRLLGRGRTKATSDVAPSEETKPPASVTEGPGDALTLRTSIFIAFALLIAGVSIALFAPAISKDGWEGLAILFLLAITFERVGLKIYGDTQVSAAVVALFAIAVVYGAPGVAVTAPLVVLAARAFTPSRWFGRLFDMSSYAIANVVAALVFHAIIDVDGAMSGWWILATIIAVAVNYVVNVALVGAVVSVESGERWFSVWREKAQWLFPYYIIFGLLGLALAAGYIALGVPGVLAFVAPPLMMRFALHQYVTKTEDTVLELKQKNAELNAANRDIIQMTERLAETYNGTLEALVMALDARDRETKGHSLRVTQFVMLIGRQLGVREDSQEWIDMQRGALLHDVGKIGVPDYILHKPGPLTPEEWDDMKRHPNIGNEMLREITFLSGAASIVHAHHERFDGKGYPRGLTGENTPLGARIFNVADAFDAMTTDRPYRKALPTAEAREEVLRNSGTQFDPEVVQAFLMVFDELVQSAAEQHAEEETHIKKAA